MGADYDIAALKARLLEKMGDAAHCYPVQLEQKFPHVLARLVDLWGTPAMDPFLEGLMVADRPSRQGFPADVAMEIFRLSTAHGALGLAPKQAGTGWAGVDDAELYRKSVRKE